MLGIGLALGSAALWGCADFFGGATTRRLPVLAVTLFSQAAGFVGLVAIFAFHPGLAWHSFGLGLASGLGGAVGLTLLYRALALGTMSVVAPIVSCGTVIPVAFAIAGGERPSALALGGAGAAFAGIVLASLDERRSDAVDRRGAIPIALGAAVACGLFLYFLGLGSRSGDVLSTLLGARTMSLALLATAALRVGTQLRHPPAALALMGAIGVADLSANALFALSTHHALLALVSVIGSLYPVVTVVLAHLLLGERITATQRIGVAFALAGVALVSIG